MRPGQGPLAATSGGSRPRESPAPGRQRRLGRGASGHAPAAPSGAERSRARPSAAEPSRAARSRLVQLRPRRSAVRGSGVVAAAAASAGLSRPAGHPPGRRPGAWGERHGRGRRRRRCQVSARRGPPAPRAPATVSPRVCVSLCLSAPCVCAGSFPPRLSPGAARSVPQPKHNLNLTSSLAFQLSCSPQACTSGTIQKVVVEISTNSNGMLGMEATGRPLASPHPRTRSST